MLFEPFTLKGTVLRNRLVRSATYEKLADERGFVTSGLIDMYEKLAEGGVGCIVTGNALVHQSGMSVPRMIGVHEDVFVEGLSRLAERVHRKKGAIVLQLVHGGRQCYPELLGGNPPLAPSAVYEPLVKTTPKAMSEEEIEELIDAFGNAAARAKAAGFDGVQIHGAHGYLVNEFLSPHTNKRDDRWGGDEERRFRFVHEIVKAIRQRTGKNYLLLIKMNGEDFIAGGLTIAESVRIARRLEEASVDGVEISGGIYESGNMIMRTNVAKEEDEGYFRLSARPFKEALSIPVTVVGGIRSRAVAEDIVRKGDADMVALARPLIREPDLPRKFMDGKEKADCISCNGCTRFKKLDHVECMVLKKQKQ